MVNSQQGEHFYCKVAIRSPGGKVIYEATTRAPAGAVLQSLNIAKQRFVEWLDREVTEEANDGD